MNTLTANQETTNSKSRLYMSAIFVLLILVALFSLSFGQIVLDVGRLYNAFFVEGGDLVAAQIVTDIRLPRVITAIISGAALGISGVLMQALFRNPMADAWSLGLLAGGQMGVAFIVTAAAFAGPAALAFLSDFQGIGLTAGAIIGVAVFAILMAGLSRKVSNITLLVVGLMLGFTVQGLVSVVMHFASRIGGKVFSGWNDGTFAATEFSDIGMMMIPIAVGCIFAIASAKGLSALLLGDSYAKSMGADVKRLRWLTLSAVVLLVAPVTAYCGPVTFIGLIVPHFARAIARTSQIFPLLPIAAICGSLLAVIADTIVHLPWEQHFLHLNSVLAIIGAPVVIVILLSSPALRGRI